MEENRLIGWVPVMALGLMMALGLIVWWLVPGLPKPHLDFGPPPPPEEHPKITLHGVESPKQTEMEWTAYYVTPVRFSEAGQAVVFEDRHGRRHTVRLTRKSAREAEMEAVAVGVDKKGELRFAYRAGPGIWRELPEGSQGMGNRMNPLVPMRHVAADQTIFPYGSMVYVPVAAGVRIGNRRMDGYFWVADSGGRIRGHHMDLFVGEHENYEAFVKSNHPTHHPTRIYPLPRPAKGYDPRTKAGLAALMVGAGSLAADGAADEERVKRALETWQRKNPFIPEPEYGNPKAATTLWFLVQLGHELALAAQGKKSSDG